MRIIKHTIVPMLVCLGLLTSCFDLDVKPKNLVGDDEAFQTMDGMEGYLAKVYDELPIEDFRYSIHKLFNNQSQYQVASAVTGEALCRDIGGADTEGDYWDAAYSNIRRANYFLETLPKYAALHDERDVNHLMGEAKFLRAYIHFALVKRYGGIPYIDKVLDYPAKVSMPETYLYRDSEEEVWDRISEDLDFAYNNMYETSLKRGHANRYVAAGIKSRAMLYAGSIAMYNESNHIDPDTGKRLCGIPQTRAADYFRQSYQAALLVEGKYSLYKKQWSAGDREAQTQNFIKLFLDADNPEIILSKDFFYPSITHSWDKFMLNRQWVQDGIGSSTAPTLDFVEMFEGIPKTDDGRFKCFDQNGHYILYDEPFDAFTHAEPRLRATVLVPGETFKGEVFDLRRGIYKESIGAGITRLLPENSTDNYPDSRIAQSGDNNQMEYELPDGTKMYPAGKGGIYSSNRESAFTGFSLRKFLDPDMPNENAYENRSVQQWVELRYAEVMLNRAEAAYELHLAGESGVDYVQDAFELVNEIRERGGATPMADKSEMNDIDIIRTERRKELGFENKVYWDLRRWRILHQEQDSRLYRALMPFYVAENGKYFFDARLDERTARYTFDQRRYYHPIPGGEMSKNPNMYQNPGY